jgi:hypothetical protein
MASEYKLVYTTSPGALYPPYGWLISASPVTFGH